MTDFRHGLVIFSGANCPGCVMAERWMLQHGVPFKKVVVDGDREMISLLEASTGQRTVPQFFLNGTHLARGFSQVKEMVAMGLVSK